MSEVSRSRAVLAQGSKSFAIAARLFPRRVADDAAVIYAFLRRADDAIDEAPRQERPGALEQLRLEVERVYSASIADDGGLAAFQEVVRRRRIPRQYADELLRGLEMDVSGQRYRSLDELLLYCHRVAGTVGLLMCHVMGVTSPAALRHAAHLGIAMQLTNICRDVAEDWRDGRLYLPHDWLGPAPLPGGPFPRSMQHQARAVVGRLLSVADGYYRSGEQGLPMLSRRCALAVRAARVLYCAIGDELRARACDVLGGRAVVSLPRKLLLLSAVVARSLLELPRGPAEAVPPGLVLHFPDDVLPL